MGIRINTNITSLAAQRVLTKNRMDNDRSLTRLSSGSRINKAADDAAGLAIGSKMEADIRSLRQAARNGNDGISSFQVAEGALNTVDSMIVRFRELAIQSSSDTISNVERGFINKEVQQLKQEINRISEVTEFNGRKLINGDDNQIRNIQVGIYAGQGFEYSASQLNSSLKALKLDDLDLSTKEGSRGSLGGIDDALTRVNDMRATLGADQNRLFSIVRNLETYHENLSAARSRIMDTDVAAESSELTKTNILSQAGISVLSQANQNPQVALKLLG